MARPRLTASGRRYTLVPGGLDPVRGLIDDLRPRPRFDESVLDGLDLEVRRTTRDRRDTASNATTSPPVEETA